MREVETEQKRRNKRRKGKALNCGRFKPWFGIPFINHRQVRVARPGPSVAEELVVVVVVGEGGGRGSGGGRRREGAGAPLPLPPPPPPFPPPSSSSWVIIGAYSITSEQIRVDITALHADKHNSLSLCQSSTP